MLICETCKKKGHRCAPNLDGTCGVYEKRIMTNFERIKAMSVEEMAEFLDAAIDCSCVVVCNNYDRCRRNNAIEPICKNHYKQWLESEVAE